MGRRKDKEAVLREAYAEAERKVRETHREYVAALEVLDATGRALVDLVLAQKPLTPKQLREMA